MTPLAPPRIAEVMASPLPAQPRFAFVRTPAWDQVEQITKDGLREFIDASNEMHAGTIDVVDLPAPFAELYEDLRVVMERDLARSFADEYARGADRLSDILREMIERGQKVEDSDYEAALAKRDAYNGLLDEIFEQYDAILTPATTGPAPAGIEATGSPIMNSIWTFCGTPALNLPLLQSPDGLPFGVQAVGPRGGDARLFRDARWLVDVLSEEN